MDVMTLKNLLARILFFAIIIAALAGYLNSAIALVLGFLLTLLLGKQFPTQSKKAIQYCLKIAVVGLGFGMLIGETLQASREGAGLTVLSIIITVGLGTLLTRLFKIDLKLGHLITSGTAICGGSAIAAVSPVIKAEGKIISISLGIVFLLNSVALFVFPPLGHLLGLTQSQFGLWCAVAIHDTSSVVGAALSYGDEALRIATTVKLSRTLWIIPLALFSMFLFKGGGKIKIPYFIGYFILAIIINSYHLLPAELTQIIVLSSKRLLVATLFLVGTTISIGDLKATGAKPMILGAVLWIVISIFALLYILYL